MPRFVFLITSLITGIIFFFSCGHLKKDAVDETQHVVKKNWKQVEELKDIDREFEAYSRDSGMRKGYLEFLDEEAILLRPNHHPLVAANALDFVSQLDENKYDISWQVQDGDVSSSNDLGFTYGVYTVVDKQSKDTLQRGTYGMVWKKNKKGMWKVMMDAGSPGLEEEADSVAAAKQSE